MKIVKVVCFSGGKDSTAMLITLLKNNAQIDDIIYVDMGEWMWSNAKEHLKLVEERLGVTITRLDVTEEIQKGFERWGFPSFFNRWCTGVKKEAMRQFLQNKYKGERERKQNIH